MAEAGPLAALHGAGSLKIVVKQRAAVFIWIARHIEKFVMELRVRGAFAPRSFVRYGQSFASINREL